MASSAAKLCLLFALGVLLEARAMAADLASLWNYADPAGSEQRFREALAGAEGDDVLILQTQIARTHGLRRNFTEARRVLAGIEDAVLRASPEARVRYELELGRTYVSTVHTSEEVSPEDRARARSLYTGAFERARSAGLDYLAIDALHMMSSVDTEPNDQLAWDLKALAFMEASPQAEAKKWEGSLRNNVGYANHLRGDYEEAIAQYRLSLVAYARSGRAADVRIAHWMIARTFRAQGRIEEAIDIQLRLEREWDEAGEPDPYVYEELEHLYRAAGDSTLAQRYAAKLRSARQPP